jgi:DNA primase small subunit
VTLKELKKHHYENTELLVSDIPRREIALGLNIRAQHFTSAKELASTLSARSNIEGAFASTAYYLDPNVKTPSKRGHLGYDLVFDVDVKPSTNRVDWLYDVCFRTSALVDILVNELGFSKEEMHLDFSGGKGFHITIDNPSYRDLSKTDRTQLVNYIIGEKVDRKSLKFGKGGWNRRFSDFMRNLVKLMNDDTKTNYKLLKSLGLHQTTTKKLGDLLTDSTKREALSKGRLDLLDKKVLASLQSHFFNQQKQLLSLVDKGVTTDAYRILRIPGTIHPKTGFVSTRLHIDDINDPDAIFEKIKDAGGRDEVIITLTKETVEDFDTEKIWPAGTHEVPRWLALHLLHQ